MCFFLFCFVFFLYVFLTARPRIIHSALKEGNSYDVFLSLHKRNSARAWAACGSPDPAVGEVDPLDEIAGALKEAGLAVWTDDGNDDNGDERTAALVSSALVVICASAEYARDDATMAEAVFVARGVGKDFLVCIVGEDMAWYRRTALGLLMAGELYIDCRAADTFAREKKAELMTRAQAMVAEARGVGGDGGSAASGGGDAPGSRKSPHASQVFLSYCWSNSVSAMGDAADGCADPRELASALGDAGLDVWLDVMRLGKRGLYADIADGLEGTKMVVACISEHYAKSRNCQMELRQAVKSLSLPVIVAVVGSAPPDDSVGNRGVDGWRGTEVGMLVNGFDAIRIQSVATLARDIARLVAAVQARVARIEEDESMLLKGKEVVLADAGTAAAAAVAAAAADTNATTAGTTAGATAGVAEKISRLRLSENLFQEARQLVQSSFIGELASLDLMPSRRSSRGGAAGSTATTLSSAGGGTVDACSHVPSPMSSAVPRVFALRTFRLGATNVVAKIKVLRALGALGAGGAPKERAEFVVLFFFFVFFLLSFFFFVLI
jgi:hypothetical protein